jgi:hypothetical protein
MNARLVRIVFVALFVALAAAQTACGSVETEEPAGEIDQQTIDMHRDALARMPMGGASSLSFVCGTFVCSCSGDDDCNDMFDSGVCGGDAVCYEEGGGAVNCYCWRWGGFAM